MAKKAKDDKPRSAKPLYKLTGTASFPFLAKTAKDEARFPEDKYKVFTQVQESVFVETDFARDVLALGREWFKDDTLELSEVCVSIKFLNEDLDEEDKYYKFKKDMVRLNAKATKKQPPTIYDADKTILTAEADILKISNGCKINSFIAPYCYGDQDKYVAWIKKLETIKKAKAKDAAEEKKKLKLIEKHLSEKPVFGIGLGLQGVQFLDATSGRGAMNALTATMLDDTEVSVDDMAYGDEDSDSEVDLSSDDESVDLS